MNESGILKLQTQIPKAADGYNGQSAKEMVPGVVGETQEGSASLAPRFQRAFQFNFSLKR